MSTTKLLIGLIVIVALAFAGYLYLAQTPSMTGESVSNETDATEPTGSVADFVSSVEADMNAEAAAAMSGSDVDASLSAQSDTVTNLTNSTNDSNF